MTKIAIHQSQYLPWAPYFKKIAQSDIFVFLDNVQYQKNGVQNRNKIRNKDSEFWLTIPVNNSLNENINKKVFTSSNVLKKQWKSIEQCYSKTRNWEDYNDKLYELFTQKHTLLIDLNQQFIYFFLKELDVKTELYLSSQLNVSGEKNNLILDICKKLDAKEYISGTGALDYMDDNLFVDEGIKISYLKSSPPIYHQSRYENFIPGLSMIDFFLNCSKDEVINYLKGE